MTDSQKLEAITKLITERSAAMRNRAIGVKAGLDAGSARVHPTMRHMLPYLKEIIDTVTGAVTDLETEILKIATTRE